MRLEPDRRVARILLVNAYRTLTRESLAAGAEAGAVAAVRAATDLGDQLALSAPTDCECCQAAIMAWCLRVQTEARLGRDVAPFVDRLQSLVIDARTAPRDWVVETVVATLQEIGATAAAERVRGAAK
ncbi:MAG: hypothetical protein KDC98_16845 [Planctomycetes bacterium]|nr:hypothetical protein [Planctomycetota bacterium]